MFNFTNVYICAVVKHIHFKNMETKSKRGKKPLPYSAYLEAEKVYLTGKSAENIAAFKALSETDKKKTLAQVKSRMKKQAGADQPIVNKAEGVIEAVDALFKAIKKEGAKMTEKQLVKLFSKVEDVQVKIEEAKLVAKQKESEEKQNRKAKDLAKKKAALEALKKEISRLEHE